MHIAIDARELVGHATGAGRYLSRLLAHWDELPRARGHSYTLVAHDAVDVHVPHLDLRSLLVPGQGGTRWEQWTFPAVLRQLRADVLFAPAYTAPLRAPMPVALAVHDVSFAAHPEWFRPTERWRRRTLTRAAARRARRILTLSRFSRAEIVGHLGVDASRIRVIPLGLGLTDDPMPAPDAGSPSDPLILFVGSIFNRRHVPALVRALPAVVARFPQARLVLVGDNRTYPREDPAAEAAAVGMREHVDVLAFVDDEQLRALYRRAAVFVFLSAYEGFGLTPLEALAAGVPIVVLDTPVAREVYGAAAHFVAAPDPPLVAHAIVRMLEDRQARLAVLSEAPGVLAQYRWPEAAARTLDAIEEAALP